MKVTTVTCDICNQPLTTERHKTFELSILCDARIVARARFDVCEPCGSGSGTALDYSYAVELSELYNAARCGRMAGEPDEPDVSDG